MKKYSLTKETKEFSGKTLFRIKAETSFGIVSKGALGGFIEKEENLSHGGNAWVYGNAEVYGNARVCGNAKVFGGAWVYDNAWVYGNARVCGNAKVFGGAWVYDNAWVYGDAEVYGDAWVFGNAKVYDKLKLLAGCFFSVRHRKEEIKYHSIDKSHELIYKGDAKFGEDPKSLSGKTVKVEVDGETYEAVIK